MNARAWKRRIGRAIPYPLIDLGRKLIHYGPNRCPVCEGRYRRALDSGYGYAMLEELRVVGGMLRRADMCPLCHSSARERLVWSWLTRRHPAFADPGASLAIAHFAPEKGLTLRLRARFGEDYRACDFDPSRYRHLDRVERQDLSALTLGDASVDLVICNHVIEHVPDPARALGEIRRIMRPGAVAILQVPLALELAAMRDGGHDKTGAERIALFGQDDHLRLYTPAAWQATLDGAGFAVDRYRAFDDDPVAAGEWQLDPLEDLYLARVR